MALEENPDLEKLLFVWQNYWKIGHLLGGTIHAIFFFSLQISDYIFSYRTSWKMVKQQYKRCIVHIKAQT